VLAALVASGRSRGTSRRRAALERHRHRLARSGLRARTSIVAGALLAWPPHSTRHAPARCHSRGRTRFGRNGHYARSRRPDSIRDGTRHRGSWWERGLLVRTLKTLLQEDRASTRPAWWRRTLDGSANDPTTDPISARRRGARFHREALRRLSAIPGVELAAVTTSLPTTGGAFTASSRRGQAGGVLRRLRAD